MITTIVESTIHAPLEKVFSYVADLETMVNYNSSVKDSTWVVNTESSRISKIKISLSILNFSGEYKITEFIEHSKIVAKCNTATIEFEDTYFFYRENGSTILKIEDRMQLKGLLSFSEGIVSPIMKQEMQSNLKTLTSLLET
jgi:ligand-binding SRPBCC domain-containing protein